MKTMIEVRQRNSFGSYMQIKSLILGASCVLLGCGSPYSPDSAERIPLEMQELPSGIVTPSENNNSESYARIYDSGFRDPLKQPLSTFSIDVDNASYSNVRRFLTNGELPPIDAVRAEEMINYFNYDYAQPSDDHPFSVRTEISDCPWNEVNRLVHIGLQGRLLENVDTPPSNLVFLIDVSGSMQAMNKLPLLKRSLGLLLEELSERDRLAIVVYASATGLVLRSTSAVNKEQILDALDELEAGGSTAGGAGIKLAYQVAKNHLIEGGNNRVILATDGDLNVGVSSDQALVRLIEQKRKDNIYLTICGFGTGNLKDDKMEQISNAGNGNYYYIDNMREAKKVFVYEMRGSMFTIAKDVKVQLEFNPNKVSAYRLIGYENRIMSARDFNNDRKDAGELGEGHTVTALYEIIPSRSAYGSSSVDKLKYQETELPQKSGSHTELFTVKFRYKPLESSESIKFELPVLDQHTPIEKSTNSFRFSAAVAGYAMLLRKSEYSGNWNYGDVIRMAENAIGHDRNGYRMEFIQLAGKAAELSDMEDQIVSYR